MFVGAVAGAHLWGLVLVQRVRWERAATWVHHTAGDCAEDTGSYWRAEHGAGNMSGAPIPAKDGAWAAAGCA